MEPASGTDVLIALDRAHHRIRSHVDERMADLDISYAQARVLQLIAEPRGRLLYAGQIARILGVSRQDVHALIRRLPSYVEAFPIEGGVRRIALTSEGRCWLDLFLGPLRDAERGIERRLAPEQRDMLTDLLTLTERAARGRWLLRNVDEILDFFSRTPREERPSMPDV